MVLDTIGIKWVNSRPKSILFFWDCMHKIIIIIDVRRSSPSHSLSRSIFQSSWAFNVFLFFFLRCFAALLCTKLLPFFLFSIDVLYVDDERKSRPIQLYQCDPSVKGRHRIDTISMVQSVQTKTSIYYQNSDAFFCYAIYWLIASCHEVSLFPDFDSSS